MDSGMSNLAVTELVIFAFVLLTSSFCVVRHGFGGSMKWPSITLLALLHVIESAYQISTKGNTSDAVEIMDAVGLFLILLAFTGVLEPLTMRSYAWICTLLQLLLLLTAIIVIIGFAVADLGLGRVELQSGLVIFIIILVVEIALVGVAFVKSLEFRITREMRGRGRDSFMVTEASESDNSTIALSPKNMDALQLSYGDIVLVGAKWRKQTVLIATPREDVDDESAQINFMVRQNLNVKLGDFIRVRPYQDIKHAKRVAVLPIANTLKGFTGSLFDRFLVPYFYEANRPIRQGDRFIVDEDMMHVEFEVVKVDPPEYGIVTQDTVIYYGGEPIQCAGEDPDLFEVQCNSVTTCGNIRSQVNYAALSIPFIIVRLVYTLLNGFDKQLLSSGSSAISDIARAAMVILMEVFILTIFLFIDFCDPISTISKDEVLFAEEGESIKS